MERWGQVGLRKHLLKVRAWLTEWSYRPFFQEMRLKARLLRKKNNAQNVFRDIRVMATSPLLDAVYVASPNSLHYERFFLP